MFCLLCSKLFASYHRRKK